MKPGFWTSVMAILRKDLLTEYRSRELVSAMALFTLLSLLVFSFSLQLDRVARREVIGGVLWVTLTFAVILGFNRSSVIERESGSFEAVLLSPVDRSAIFLGKLLSNALFACIVGLLLLPVISVIFNIALVRPAILGMVLLGTLGLSTVGTLLSLMTVQTRTRETLLPIVMLPVALPLLLAAVTMTTSVANDAPWDTWRGWLLLVAAVDGIYFLLCFLLFDAVIEE